jgi:hypothetical protein
MTHFALSSKVRSVHQSAFDLCDPSPNCSRKQLHVVKSIRVDLAKVEDILVRTTATLAASEALLAKHRVENSCDKSPEVNLSQLGYARARWVTAVVPASKNHFGILRHNVANGPTEPSTHGSLDRGLSGNGYTKLQLLPALRKLSLLESEIISILKPLSI